MRLKNNKSLTKRFILKTVFSIFIFTCLYILLLIVGYYIVSMKLWLKSDVLYKLLSSLKTIILPIWLFGVLIIIIFYWKRTFTYIHTIEQETTRLLIDDKTMVSLPKDLETIETSVNFIKHQSIVNKGLALEEKQKKDELIVCLAHDLKTPLTSIIGYLDLIMTKDTLEEKEIKKYLNIIMNKSISLQNSIDELFQVSKLNNPNLNSIDQEIDLELLMKQIIDDFYPLLMQTNRKINFKNEKGKIFIKGNSEKLFRAFSNLFKNAINYSYDNSVIDVALNYFSDEKRVSIKISNSCNHISTDKLKKIFEKFYRCDSSRNSKTGGSGLGLAIAKEIIELHNGSISAASYKNSITFTIIFLTLSKS